MSNDLPTAPGYWRETVTDCIRLGKTDPILNVEDFIEMALARAYRLGYQNGRGTQGKTDGA